MSASSDYIRVLTDITREGGATRAATARANAQIWGGTVAKLGDFASDAIKQYSVDKKAKKDEQWQQDISDLFKRSAEEYKAQQEPSMAEMTGGIVSQGPQHYTLEQRIAGVPQQQQFPGNDLPQQGGITGTQFGQRADGTPKGSGYFGALSRPDGSVSSEISIGINVGGKEVEVPALVPTLTPEEKNWLLTNDISDPSKIPPTIVQKAADFARQRMAAGQSPFAGPSESPRQSSFTGPELKNARPPRQSPFPTPSEILALGQPLNGIKVIDGLAALQKLNPQDDDKTRMERMRAAYVGLDQFSEAQKAQALPGLMQAFEKVYGIDLGEKTYTPERWAAFGKALQVSGAKPGDAFTLSEGQTRFGPDGKPIATVPKSGSEAGFTLSPGSQRYDAQGKLIAEAPKDTAITPYQAAQLKLAQQRLALAMKNADKPAAKKETDGLVDTVLENPALWDQLTPTVRGQIAPELRERGYTNFGKPMSEAAMKSIAESQSALDSLTDLRSTLKANEQYIGPIAGLSALNPYSEARKAQANIDLVRQRVGKALEGGVLRKEDEEKYKKILATLRDTPDTAIYKVDSLIKNIQNNIDNFKAAQRLGGKNLDLSGSNPPAKPETKTPTVGSIVMWQGKRYRVKAITNGQAELEEP